MIKVLIKNKENNSTAVNSYVNIEELEMFLKTISTVKYQENTYTITADCFELLADGFKEKYNEEYFDIDYDLETISIKKMQIGKKRNKKFEKEDFSSGAIAEKAVKRLRKKIPTIEYDKEKNIVCFSLFGVKVEFDVNIDYTLIKKRILLNGSISFHELKTVLQKAKWLVDYFRRLSKRIEKKGD